VLCLWAMNQKYVRSVRAETLPENVASQRVLEKNGFVFLGASNGLMKWQLHSDFMQKAKQYNPQFK
jgi:[ribosomal protein S5]-alanine N-acetyltransferase